MKRQYGIYLVILFFLISCKENSINKVDVKKTKIVKSTTDANAKLLKNENVENRYINNITDISKDSIIACKYSVLMYSTNGAKTWKNIETSFIFKDITFTDKKILVGIDSWMGIHEADYSRIYISKDFGNSWETITFDTKKFFPMEIISNPKEQLCVLTSENKIYKLQGTDYKKDWVYVKTRPETEYTRDVMDYPYGVNSEGDNLKLYKKNNNKTDTLACLDLCSEAWGIVQKDKVVHVSGVGIDRKTGKRYGYYGQLIHDKTLKQYKLPGLYANIKKTKFNVYIICENGLYVEKNDKIEQLY
ncbi:WD40/YVTN/BNR-like repeat-containing protein [Flavobacterium pectinovorum]|uniref:Sortilin N-terminal domain-containing protein n=1 Tax=Flavobacterium pectinovorum TaxID=29533 RepID=A0A502EMX3_9FLAO|nr:hypothetical protein [Flavobacterium pectinovorum]TPG37890.1 hypothetical protein EAH81_18375 [Flavobacterium pectinovorum]